jgi:hypothetical protein
MAWAWAWAAGIQVELGRASDRLAGSYGFAWVMSRSRTGAELTDWRTDGLTSETSSGCCTLEMMCCYNLEWGRFCYFAMALGEFI